jgi:hypothetical protein
MKFRIETLARPEEVLTGATASQVNGAGLNIVCGPRGCYVAPPAPVVYPTFGYPTYGYPGFGYGAYPTVFGASPFYGPVVTTPFVPNYFAPRYW